MTAPLDMSVLAKDWTPTVTDRKTVASMPLDKELALSVSLHATDGRGRERASPFGVEQRDARTLILSANVDDVTLFELRFWEGRLRLNAGTGEAQNSQAFVYGADNFDFQVSFNPMRGGLAIVASWVTSLGERTSHTFIANISNLKLPKAKYYTLRLGAPKHFADLSLLGWRVDATYDLAPPVTATTCDAVDVRLIAPAPLDTLRLALQSIDSWRKVAEGALHELEGGVR